MTYKEKAIDIICEKLYVDKYNARQIVECIDNYLEFTPSVFGILNVPEGLEDWSEEII